MPNEENILKHLPKTYTSKIVEKLGLFDDKNTRRRIIHVRHGRLDDSEIMLALVKLAKENKMMTDKIKNLSNEYA